MNTVFLNYVYAMLALSVLYHILPKRKMYVDNIYLFIGLGMLIYMLLIRVMMVKLEGFNSCNANNDGYGIDGMYHENDGNNSSNSGSNSGNSGSNSGNSEKRVHFENNDNNSNSNYDTLLTNTDILKHVQAIVKNINNKGALQDIKNALNGIDNVETRDAMKKIYDLTLSNPVLLSRLALSSPQSILDLATLSSDLPELRDSLNKNKNNSSVQKLEEKLNRVESMLKNINGVDSVPEYVKKMLEQGKYVNYDGMVRDMLNSDMKYNQLNPDQMQHELTREDDDWDTTGYTLVDPAKIRPPDPVYRDYYQEGDCPVCPSLTHGYPVNLLEFDKARYVIGSDNISLDYIKKLNERK